MFSIQVKKSEVKQALYWVQRDRDCSEEETSRAYLIERMMDYNSDTNDDEFVTVDEDMFKFLRIG
jgi:hypothetical protein